MINEAPQRSSPLAQFIKATVVGGLLFLIPVVLVLMLLERALGFALKFSKPVSAYLNVDGGTGVLVSTTLAITLLVLISFGAGMLSRTSIGKQVTAWFETSLLGNLPQYKMAKNMTDGMAELESDNNNMKPIMINQDDSWQLGYWIEDMPDGWVAVFLPQSPTPMSGNVLYVRKESTKPLDIPMRKAMSLVKRAGGGSKEVLQGFDFKQT